MNAIEFSNKTFAAKSSVIRAAKPLIEANILHLNAFTVEQNEEGKFFAKLIPVVDGYTYCPHCGIHLDNGVGYHGQDVNGKAIKHESFEYECLACGEEFGPEIGKKATPVEKTSSKRVVSSTSTVELPTKKVWHIADSAEMKGKSRKEVIEACVAAGIAYNTARTQYQQWFTATKNSTPVKG